MNNRDAAVVLVLVRVYAAVLWTYVDSVLNTGWDRLGRDGSYSVLDGAIWCIRDMWWREQKQEQQHWSYCEDWGVYGIREKIIINTDEGKKWLYYCSFGQAGGQAKSRMRPGQARNKDNVMWTTTPVQQCTCIRNNNILMQYILNILIHESILGSYSMNVWWLGGGTCDDDHGPYGMWRKRNIFLLFLA